ncbi:MAG: 3-phosphoshikimate 1-carboxyvinyltransferase, partial [Thermodesulfobacteriota bacterium]
MKKRLTISPYRASIRGEISIPGDKSISHRAVMLGAIAEGDTFIKGFLDGADNLATIAAFRAMGVHIEEQVHEGEKDLLVHGVGLKGLQEPRDVINALNSGTTARLLTGLLSGQSFFSVITGDTSLRSRPMGRVVDPLRVMGAKIIGREDSSLLPLALAPADLKSMSYSTPVASAQLKSSILLAGLYAEGETKVTEPAPSRDHTERMLKAMGGDIVVEGPTSAVRGGTTLKGIDIDVPGDISSAAFLMVAALIVPDSELLIRGVGVNPTRTGIINILQEMGADITLMNERGGHLEPTADILVRSSGLTGIEITGEKLLPAIDEFPVITVAAAFAEGTTRITGAWELRVKESDRISAM